jgi:hypothetical protein
LIGFHRISVLKIKVRKGILKKDNVGLPPDDKNTKREEDEVELSQCDSLLWVGSFSLWD